MNSSNTVAVVVISGGSYDERLNVATRFTTCIQQYVGEVSTRYAKGRAVMTLRRSLNGKAVQRTTKEVLEKRRTKIPRGIRIVCRANNEHSKKPITRRRSVKF